MIKRTKPFTIALSAVIAFFFAGASAFFLNAGRWMCVHDPVPDRLDVLFTFGGERARVVYSRGLAERIPGIRWVMSDYFHGYSRLLTRGGFDIARVTVIDTCRATLSEIKGFAAWLKDNKNALVKSALSHDTSGVPAAVRVHVGFVSNPCHMRRIKFMADDVLRDTTFRCFYLPVLLERYGWTPDDLHHWWRSKALRSWVASETGKLLWYWLFS